MVYRGIGILIILKNINQISIDFSSESIKKISRISSKKHKRYFSGIPLNKINENNIKSHSFTKNNSRDFNSNSSLNKSNCNKRYYNNNINDNIYPKKSKENNTINIIKYKDNFQIKDISLNKKIDISLIKSDSKKESKIKGNLQWNDKGNLNYPNELKQKEKELQNIKLLNNSLK